MLRTSGDTMLRIVAGEGRSFLRNTGLAFPAVARRGCGERKRAPRGGRDDTSAHDRKPHAHRRRGRPRQRLRLRAPARYVLFFLAGAVGATLAIGTLVRRGLLEPVPALLIFEATLLAGVATAGNFAPAPVLVTEVPVLLDGLAERAHHADLGGGRPHDAHDGSHDGPWHRDQGTSSRRARKVFARLRLRGLFSFVRGIPPESDVARAALHLTAIVCFLVGATARATPLRPLRLPRDARARHAAGSRRRDEPDVPAGHSVVRA